VIDTPAMSRLVMKGPLSTDTTCSCSNNRWWQQQQQVGAAVAGQAEHCNTWRARRLDYLLGAVFLFPQW
jgi:hypothetical protein